MKTQLHLSRPRKGGFSAIELVITVAILGILMGVVKMRSSSLLDRTKVAKITQTADALRSACVLFHTDTSQYAKHGDMDTPLLASKLAGWNGPYLEVDNLDSGNPFGEFTVDNQHSGFGIVTGWDLDSDGKEEVSGACNVVLLTGIDEATATQLNTYYDGSDASSWETMGRFQYIPTSQSGLIFLYQ